MPIIDSVSSTLDTSTPTGGAALAAILDELAAIPESDVLTPRVDVPAAALVGIGASPKIELHRAAILARFGATGARSLDRLVPLARAMNLTHGALVVSIDEGLEDIARELSEERSRLVTDAEILIERKVLRPNALAKLVGGQAYDDRIDDVTALLWLFRSQWDAISTRTNVTEADLDRAERLMETFSRLLAVRAQASAQTSEAGRLRARAFTLFFRTYSHIRRMITFLRFNEGDADEIAPSLYGGRKRRRDDDVIDAAPPPVAPAPVVAPVNPIPPGMPGADPFQP